MVALSQPWNNSTTEVDDYFDGVLPRGSTKRWNRNPSRDETRGTNVDQIELRTTNQGTANTLSVEVGASSYEALIAAIQKNAISDLEIRRILKGLVIEFPNEGLLELIETMRDMHDFYMQKRNYVPQIVGRFEQKQIVITGTYVRPSFLTPSEE